jgi:alpha-galactosidase
MISLSIRVAAYLGTSLVILGTGLGVSQGAVVPDPQLAGFSLTTKAFTVYYKVDKDGSLLNGVKKPGDAGAFPVGGQVFPGRFVRSKEGYCHGPRYAGPLSVALPGGDSSLDLVYESHRLIQESSNVEHAVIMLRDRQVPVGVELHVRAYRDESVVEQWLVLRNGTMKPVHVKRLDSLYLQGQNGDKMFLEWYESKEGNEASRPEREKFLKGGRLLESRHGNRHVSGPEPFFSLGFGDFPDEEKVPCMVAALSWSGSTRLSFEIHEGNALESSFGVNQPLTVMVGPEQSLTSPTCVYSFSAAGKGPASRNFHRWMRRYGLRDGDRLRLVDNNSWEGCGMEVSESSVVDMMKISAELGIELYVMDDGWFGNGDNARTCAKAGLGDWQINRKRFPNGLEPLLKAGRESNIALGIWFEPEMVNPRSTLFLKHPDWVMRVPGRELDLQRDQVVLDVVNPAVQEFMFHSVNNILKACPGIRFVKWDANSSINNPYSPFLGADRQGEMLNRYMAGYYGVLEKLVAAYPEIDFQACAAGGGRSDLGALKYSHTFWPSDNTNPGYRLGAIWNFSTCLPALAATCHVTHSGGKEYQPKYRFDVAMMGQLGMEVDPRKSEPEYLEAAKVGIAAYKAVRDIVQLGDQYRHQHPYDSSTPAVNYVAADKRRALILAYQTGHVAQPLVFSCPVSGLDPLRNYRVAEINLPAGDARPRLARDVKGGQPGSEWVKQGVPLIFTRRFDSAAVLLEVVP